MCLIYPRDFGDHVSVSLAFCAEYFEWKQQQEEKAETEILNHKSRQNLELGFIVSRKHEVGHSFFIEKLDHVKKAQEFNFPNSKLLKYL